MISSTASSDPVVRPSSSRNPDVDESSGSSSDESDDKNSCRDPFLEELENNVRSHVFNKMPIRLLLLPELKLIERGAVVRYIMSSIPIKSETEFDAFLVAELKKDPSFPGMPRSDAIDYLIQIHARYAILSHTWLQKKSEIVFEDARDLQRWRAIQSKRGAAYRKLEGFCNVARDEFGVSLAWMDTICINKDSTSELEESIRSMYRWYNLSDICIIYLANTITLAEMHLDRWFTRGWTLQELLAPEKIKFYNKVWDSLTTSKNDKIMPSFSRSPGPNDEQASILQIIHKTTRIAPNELLNFQPGVSQGIASRMVWAAKRTTTRGEDCAYSLMGVFNVSFSIAYGEGAQRAFFRLLEAILTSFDNPLDILNWAGPPSIQIHASRMLPLSPESYLNHSPNLELSNIVPEKPMILTHIGLEVKLLVMYAKPILHSTPTQPISSTWGKLHDFKSRRNRSFSLQSPITIFLHHVYGPSDLQDRAFLFGIFGFDETSNLFTIPTTCPAFLFSFSTFALCSPKSTVKRLLSKTTLKPHFKTDTQAPILLSLISTSFEFEGNTRLIRKKSDILDDDTVCISAYL